MPSSPRRAPTTINNSQNARYILRTVHVACYFNAATNTVRKIAFCELVTRARLGLCFRCVVYPRPRPPPQKNVSKQHYCFSFSFARSARHKSGALALIFLLPSFAPLSRRCGCSRHFAGRVRAQLCGAA